MTTHGTPPPAGEPNAHGSTAAAGSAVRTPYQQVQDSPDFAELRTRFRRFVFPMAALFLVWYFTYVLLAAYASDFMSTKVFGNITVGLLMGLGQFLSTFIITTLYVSWANKKFDPAATALRERVESHGPLSGHVGEGGHK
ncbi:uncharacterized membrane protein (DUF485 family) [Kineococcus xinjiangensis]|uniref:Uncharacterized membrane protein (DUF485 family) n=1 Tax=Kineococcus xinjiangensis TaxID=512762 RepID=A0A2S6ISQ7_9ACTN|nr:DUF485 domain-containing protein [Kineococcus xinjiangensis]PPK97279.1 uncharacterized membrane protein (DUF485 family) [Kineococcus xinjiangensis]